MAVLSLIQHLQKEEGRNGSFFFVGGGGGGG